MEIHRRLIVSLTGIFDSFKIINYEKIRWFVEIYD